MKNIAILIPTLYGGGAERIAGLLSLYLSRRYNVYIFVEDTDNIAYDYGGTLLNIAVNGAYEDEETIREYKEKYKIDCTISFLEKMNLMNIRTKRNDLVIISERRSNGEIEPYSYGLETRIRQWYPYADKIVAVAYGVEYDLTHNYGVENELITTIYNFINKEKIAEKAKQPLDKKIQDFVGSSKLILNVGRLDPQKNQRKLLHQFAKLVKLGYDVKLIIMGTGALEIELRQMICKFGLDKQVMLISYNTNPFAYYKLASMLVLSSDCEGLPNVVLEAMTYGLPVVAVDCLSGPRELLKDCWDYENRTSGVEVCKRGILVEKAFSDETGETDYLAKGMALLLDDKALREQISKNSYAYMQEYSNEKIYVQWSDVIENTQPSKKIVPPISIPELSKYKKVIVYGAGIYGQIAMTYLKKHRNEMGLDFLSFAVSDGQSREQEVLGIPVYEISALIDHKEDSIVLVGVSETYEYPVRNTLNALGFHYVYLNF